MSKFFGAKFSAVPVDQERISRAPYGSDNSSHVRSHTQLAEPPTDLWTSRARPTFLYMMYVMILWALPLGIVAAISPRISHAIIIGMTEYLSALPDELYTLFGTGYLGYATLRQWGKVKGTDR